MFSADLLTLLRVSSSAVPFGRKIPSELLNPRWSHPVHHDTHRKVEGGSTVRARGEPRSIWDSVRARGAGFGVFEEFDHVGLFVEHLFFQWHGDYVAACKLGSFGAVYMLFNEEFGPADGKSVGGFVRVGG